MKRVTSEVTSYDLLHEIEISISRELKGQEGVGLLEEMYVHWLAPLRT